jgi:hypothetical protein
MYRVYLDNCCFNRPYDDQSSPQIQFETRAKLFIQDLVLKHEVELAWSYILKKQPQSIPSKENGYIRMGKILRCLC